MCDVSTWNAICARCEEVYEKHGSCPIPTTLSDNPHQVFLDTHVEVNVGRFVVFILWLKQHPLHSDGTSSSVEIIPPSLKTV